jgi:hypothetical protein
MLSTLTTAFSTVLFHRLTFDQRINKLRTIIWKPKVYCHVYDNYLHRDPEVGVVSSEIQRFAQKHEERLHHHENVEAIQLLDNMGIVRRLQRKKPFELV